MFTFLNLKIIKNYIPEAEDDKGSLVILVEVIGQVVIMFTALYFIHKIIFVFLFTSYI